jgi:hypothetical protein
MRSSSRSSPLTREPATRTEDIAIAALPSMALQQLVNEARCLQAIKLPDTGSVEHPLGEIIHLAPIQVVLSNNLLNQVALFG